MSDKNNIEDSARNRKTHFDKYLKSLAKKFEESSVEKKQERVQVFVRFIFDRVIDIDSKSEKFDADVILECSWFNDEVLNMLLTPNFNQNSCN